MTAHPLRSPFSSSAPCHIVPILHSSPSCLRATPTFVVHLRVVVRLRVVMHLRLEVLTMWWW